MHDVVVVGGGIAGLTCAFALRRHDADVLVLERSERLGGRIRTSSAVGAPVEMGASFFAGFYENVARLSRELGIDATSGGDSQETWVAAGNGRVGAVWPASALVRSRVVGLGGRVRGILGLARLLFLSSSVDPREMSTALKFDDVSVESWSRRSLGTEFADLVVEPLLRALFFWDVSRTSRALLPMILAGVRSDRRFFRVPGGMERLIDELARVVPFRLDSGVESIEERDGGFVVRVAGGEEIATRNVVLASPAVASVRILAQSGIDVPEELAKVMYSSIRVGVVSTQGYVWPFDSRRTLVFTADASETLVGVKPIFGDDDRLLGCRLYIRGDATSRPLASTIPQVLEDLRACRLEPIAVLLERGEIVDSVDWVEALPLFDVGYPRVVVSGDLGRGLPRGVFLAGDYLSGPHLEGAVRSGYEVADELRSGRLSR